MKNNIPKVLFAALLAMGFVIPARANPWLWPAKAPAKTPVKTVQLAVPASNGGLISVTVPAKTASARRATGYRQARQVAVDRRDEERIAADLERHF